MGANSATPLQFGSFMINWLIIQIAQAFMQVGSLTNSN